MAHTNDVIFTEQGLAEFIQQIRQNPEMVYKVRAATKDEISQHNIGKPTIADGRIPGKGITIIQADGTKTLTAVGSDIKVPSQSQLNQIEKNIDGTVSIFIDEEILNFPVNGVINDFWNTTENKNLPGTKIPNKQAIENYVEGYVEEYVEDYVDGILNGKNDATGFGFIPGYYQDDENNVGTIVWEVRKTQESDTQANLKAARVYGAVFNDYAEYRIGIANAGRCVIEKGDGTLVTSTKRLQLGGNIVSDTFGFAIGETSNAKCPIAVCGRVLAYTNEPAWTYQPGAAVCSGPNGTVSLMTREEIREWPDAIVGYVSEIPTYEYWGTDNIKVDGRIWIKVK